MTQKNKPDLKVGDTIWVRARELKQMVITGETSRSWIVGESSWNQLKLPKLRRNDWPEYYVVQSEIDDAQFISKHAHFIGQCVGVLRDAVKLRKIAEMAGYKPKNT